MESWRRFFRDIRYGSLLWRHRGFSAIAVLTLAVGIGVSTALFSVIDAALLRPLPYPHPEELVTVSVRETTNGHTGSYGPSMADIRAWRESGRVFAHVGAGRVTGFLPRIVDAGEPERLIVGDASEDFLEVYGVRPILGRGIQIEDTREGAPLVVLLGHAYWKSRFGSARDAIGRAIRIGGTPATIVGVMPAGFYQETAVWQPTQIAASRVSARGSGTPVDARLRPGITLAQAEQQRPHTPVIGRPWETSDAPLFPRCMRPDQRLDQNHYDSHGRWADLAHRLRHVGSSRTRGA